MYKEYTGYTAEQLLEDDYFVQWLLAPNAENEAFWREQRENDQALGAEMDKACSFVKHLRQDIHLPEFSLHEETDLWKSIQARNKRKKIYRLSRIVATVAAAACICLLVARDLYWEDKPEVDYLAIMESVDSVREPAEEVELVLSGNRTITIPEKESQVEYYPDGEINVNAKTVEQVTVEEDQTQVFNQLIVPLGKRSSVTFSDGTKIWVNSGSKVIYPVVFEKGKREIFVEGEVYLDVTADASRPFIVKTQQIDVKVLGTSFNISAYKNDPTMQVTLVKGKVEVDTHQKQPDRLLPNQQFDWDTQARAGKIQTVEVENYVAWKNGYYQFEREPLQAVFKKLARYYGVRLEWAEEVGKRTCYGKLDLKDELMEVLNNLKDATGLPLQFTRNGENINISMNP